jgi:predicted Zn-dependent protease
MKSSGINPSGMITTLKKLEKGRLWGTDRIPPYLLTHPTGPERMSNLDAMLSHFKPEPPKREVLLFRSDFQLFRTILRAKSLDSKDAERLFQRDLEEAPSSPLPHLGLGMVYKERSEYELAIRHLRTALKAAPSSAVILRKLGETYQLKGQNREAISILEEALELDAENRSTLFLLAISYENLESYGRAVELFEKLSYFRPVNKDIYYHLGISYGRLNKLSLAHYNFGLYFKRMRENEKAKFHFQKADQLSPNDPVLRRKIREASKGL